MASMCSGLSGAESKATPIAAGGGGGVGCEGGEDEGFFGFECDFGVWHVWHAYGEVLDAKSCR